MSRTSDNAFQGGGGGSSSNGPYRVVENLLNDTANHPLKVIGIGCGVSNIMMAYKIQKECRDVSLTLYDRNPDLGGTWFENRYPGVGCDVPSHAYAFNFALNPEWRNYCSFGDDILAYLNRVCEVFDLRKYMQFRSEIVRCEWLEDSSKWDVSIEQTDPGGKIVRFHETCDILLYATGVLNATKWPEIEGLDLFKGKIIHTSKWPQDFQKDQWEKERIAVLGSGASSIQVVSSMQPSTKKLEVFVRSGLWFSAIVDNFGIYHPYSKEDRERFRTDPKALVEYVRDLEDKMGWAVDMMTKDSSTQTEARKFFTDRMREHIKDDRLYQGFLPSWDVGCRRITPGDLYMKAIQEPNVQVHFTGAAALTENGVLGEDGIEREVDTVICATGFDTSYRPRFPIIGKDGVDLRTLWNKEPDAYMGLAAPHMPNFYIFMGPAWPVHNGSVMGPLIQVGNYVVKCIHKMQRERITSLTPRADATAQFNLHVQEWMKRTVWTEDCRSWFKEKSTGRVNAIWCGSGLHYAEIIDKPRFEDYHIEYVDSNPFAYLGSGFTLAEKTKSMDQTPFLAESELDPRWVKAMKEGSGLSNGNLTKKPLQLAYLGMGSMGKAMSKNLVKKGHLDKPIILWNRTISRATEHTQELGDAIVIESLDKAVAASDIIWSCLSDQKAVTEMFDVILQNDVQGKLFLECSTISRESTDELARKVIDAGAEFVAMPVFGEPSMANAGILTCLPAGTAPSVRRVLPYLEGVIGRKVIDLSGELPGTASHLKLIGNVLIVQMIESVAEAHALAEKTNLKASSLHEVIKSVFPGPFAIYSDRMRSGAYHREEPIVNIDMAREVASHVISLAEESGTNLAAYKVGRDHLDAVKMLVGSRGDISGIYGVVREESGLKFEN